MKKLLIKLLSRWLNPEPYPVSDASSAGITSLHIEIQDLEARLAHSESELQKAKAGNKALQDFISARHKPDKVLADPPKIVKPFAALAIAALTLCAKAQFPPQYIHNYWDTTFAPTMMTNFTADLRNSQTFQMLGPNGGDGYLWKWFTDRLELSNHVSSSWVRFNDGIQLGNGANTIVINLNRGSGDVSATTFTGTGANLTTLTASGVTAMAAFASTTNHRWFNIVLPCCTNGVTYLTNTYGGDIAFNMKGTGLSVGATTISTFPTADVTLISATTQVVGPVMGTNDVYMITNTTITGAQGRILP